MNAYHDTQVGNRLFFIGSGPSLLSQMDLLPQLAGEHTWGINELPAWSGLPFPLTYWSVSEKGHMGRHQRERFAFLPLPETQCFAFHDRKTRFGREVEWIPRRYDASVTSGGVPGLDTVIPPLVSGGSGIGTAMQLALWMGYQDIYILGSEFTETGYVWDPNASRNFRRKTGNTSVRAMSAIATAASNHGRRIIDCTRGGRLNTDKALPYKSLEEVLK
jgi:hypothetical protein